MQFDFVMGWLFIDIFYVVVVCWDDFLDLDYGIERMILKVENSE